MRARLWFLASLLIAIQAQADARRPYQVSYICHEEAETEEGDFKATGESVEWLRFFDDTPLGSDSTRIWFRHALTPAEQTVFAEHGFDGRLVGYPRLSITFGFVNDRRCSRRRAPNTVPEISVGDRSLRPAINACNSVDLRWHEAEALLQGDGDMVFTLFSADGAVLRRASLPHDALSNVERRLQSMHARVTEKRRDPERLCGVEIFT